MQHKPQTTDGQRASIRASTVPHARDSRTTPWSGTLDELEALFRQHGRDLDGKDGPAIVVSAFAEGEGRTPKTEGRVARWRQTHLVDATWLLGLDFDSREGDAAAIVAPLSGVAGIAYSTHSHGRPGKGTAPRFRRMLTLARSVTAAEYLALWQWADAYVGGGSDAACKDPTRLFYTPRRKADDATADPWIVRFDGPPLDPDNLPDGQAVSDLLTAAAATAPQRRVLSPAEAETLQEEWQALHPADADDARGAARRRVQRAIDKAGEKPVGYGRRLAVFQAACTIGNFEHALGSTEADAYARELAARGAPGLSDDDAADLVRQVNNGRDRGRWSPGSVHDLLHDLLPRAAVNDDGENTTAPAPRVRRPRAPLPIIDDDADRLPIDDARVRLLEVVAEAVHGQRRVGIIADPGVGKTRAILEALPDVVRAGMRVRYAVPTNKLAREIHQTAKNILAEALGADGAALVGEQPKRTASNCDNYHALNAARRAAGHNGVTTVCRACDLHPSNNVGRKCGFFREMVTETDKPILVTTHDLEMVRQTTDQKTIVDVRAFTRAARNKPQEPHVPDVSRTPDGELLLTLKPGEGGTPPPHLDDAVGRAEADARCRAWLASALGKPGADDIESLRAMVDTGGGVDLVIIDENPQRMLQAVPVTPDDLLRWWEAGDLKTDDAECFRAFVQSVRATADGKALAREGLAALLNPGGAVVAFTQGGAPVSKLAADAIATHGADAAQGRGAAALASFPPVLGLELLPSAIESGWRGCSASSGLLYVRGWRPIVGADAKAAIYLDGTATPETVRAVLGADAAVVRVAVELHPDTHVHVVGMDSSKSTLPSMASIEAAEVTAADDTAAPRAGRRDRAGEHKAQRAGKLLELEAVAKRFDDADTVWVLHKAWLDDPGVEAILADAIQKGRVTYHGAAEALGSNRFEAFKRIVVAADFHAPKHAVVGLAGMLELHAAGGEPSDEAAWLKQARHLVEGATVLQALYRVRPAEHAREVVMLTRADLPPFLAKRTRETLDPGHLVVDALGRTPAGLPPRWEAAHVLRHALRDQSAMALGCGFTPNPRMPERGSWQTRVRVETALQRALAQWSDHGGAVALAAAAGVAVGHARTPDCGRGGVPVFWLSDAPPPAPDVVARLLTEAAEKPPRWVEWCGERVCLDDDAPRFLEALRSLPSIDAATWEATATAAGVSVSTVRRVLHPLGVDSLEALRATWRDLTMPDAAVLEVAPDGTPTWALRGGALWLSVASSEAVAWWCRYAATPLTATAALPLCAA